MLAHKLRRVVGANSTPAIIVGSSGTAYTSNTDASSYTSSGLPSVAADERAVIAIAGRAATTRTISSVTIGGQACSALHTVDLSGNTVALYLGPVGVSGNVVVTLSAAWLRCLIDLWPCKNIQSSTPTDTGGFTTSGQSDTMNCDAGGAIFGIAYNNETNAHTWTNLTEAFDVTLESVHRSSGAADAFATAQVARAISMNMGVYNTGIAAFVSLR